MRWIMLLLAVALVSCGGESTADGDDTSAEGSNNDAYENAIQDLFVDQQGGAVSEIEELFGDAADNPMLATDSSWVADVREQANIMRDVHNDIKRLDPPADYKEVHPLILEASSCISDVGNELEEQVGLGLRGDYGPIASMLDRCTVLITDAAEEYNSVAD